MSLCLARWIYGTPWPIHPFGALVAFGAVKLAGGSVNTIFGNIARELRKYNVTLLIIDQRPSQIDAEVMSQIGTKITCLLDNERDIDSVLTGVSGKNELRSVLARLEPKQQVLIFGHAVPMPVVVRTREYGSAESYKSFTAGSAGSSREQAEKDIEELWGK